MTYQDLQLSDDHREVVAKPSEIAKIVRNARNRPAFFVSADTPLRVEGADSYLPLAGNVQVTRRAMLAYLADLQETATRQEEHRGITLAIRLAIHGTCYFV